MAKKKSVTNKAYGKVVKAVKAYNASKKRKKK